MSRREALRPVRMERVAIVAPARSLDDVLRIVGAAGVVELATPPDAQLQAVSKSAVVRGEVAALAGWMPAKVVSELARQVAPEGGAVVPLARPRGKEAPSLLRSEGLRGDLAPLVNTYGTTPYADIDPTPLAVGAYVLMFGMMFGDVGHGLLLLVAAIGLYRRRPRWLSRLHRAWPFAVGAGLASMLFGLLYGEFFGPTGVVPVLWVRPLADPIALLAAALAGGALLLAVAYLLGVVNRWREGGWPATLYSPAGVAGSALFFGLGLALLGWYAKLGWLSAAGGVIAVVGLILAFVGFYAEAGGGASATAQAMIQLFDAVVRLGANIASFARLAAFGLTHAAIGSIVWSATTGLWAATPFAAAAIFLLGNVLALTIEGLVAGVQALRLEYYELFSRVFQAEGRPFRPWHLPPTSKEVAPCSSG
ncbi:V-type ATPase 116kDa subunit family protein [Nonomuraea angiospora]|uniref:V/A-type H+-transporting ATPase subunit I n=1 Tax=Nonomuraea angiospora TaxID=46172 RepID=A0ABR9M7P2_9ACTN|nr:V-type ATPase 116kDa subunit family protein [Nonomuraea angiospora]MBE1588920.1 V/A-type H+-transporting ATPase subunit I [Nonomuraea angiospora]